jgi:diguanylate cyclase (GGDEF)-like protein
MHRLPNSRKGRRRYRDAGPAAAGRSATVTGSPGIPSEPAPVETASFEAQLQRGHRWLRFVPELERRFADDTHAARRRHLFFAGLVGTLTFDLFGLINAATLPDIAALSWQVRLILTPILLLTLCSLWLPIRPWKGEAAVAACAMAISAAVLLEISRSNSPIAYSHSVVLFLMPMFAGVAARLRFWYTLACAVLTFAGFVLVVHGQSPLDQMVVIDNRGIVGAAIVFTLLASYVLEHRERTGYLLAGLERQRRDELTRVNERLRQINVLDPLTGINNRRKFEDDLQACWPTTVLRGEPLSLLILDIDFFKLFNDGYGHPQGDACLRRVAEAVREAGADAHGIAARLGGEEFAVILPGSDVQAATAAAEAICAAVRDLGIAHRLSPIAGGVTVSVGVAEALSCAPPADDHIALMQAADHALYTAKAAGRDRIAVCDSIPSAVPPAARVH